MCDADERSRQLPRRKFLRALTTGAATVAATGGGALAAYGSSSAAEASGGSTVVAAADAPAVVKATAKYVCDGSGDEVEINQALAEFGDVELSTGTFVLDRPIRPAQGAGIRGHGNATRLRASGKFGADALPGQEPGLIDAVYSGSGLPCDHVQVADLLLDGNKSGGAKAKGVHCNMTSKTGFIGGSPDAACEFRSLTIMKTSGDGFHNEGQFAKAARVVNVRVFDADGNGFTINGNDSFYANCESGSAGRHGFLIEAANTQVANCKAWYADECGFSVTRPRVQLVNCCAQDNAKHGFHVAAAQATLIGCHADSNSHPHPDTYDGFHVDASNVTVSGAAYDKNERKRGLQQRYGVFVNSTRHHLNLEVNTRDNVSGGIGGDLTGNGVFVCATGQTVHRQ